MRRSSLLSLFFGLPLLLAAAEAASAIALSIVGTSSTLTSSGASVASVASVAFAVVLWIASGGTGGKATGGANV